MNRGFSFIELIVVMSLIALLGALGVASYGSVRRSARDTKRKADLKLIQDSLEAYYLTCGLAYPTPVTQGTSTAFSNVVCPAPTSAILPTVPVDPAATPYQCVGCTATNYKLCTPLESGAGTPLDYCVENTQ